MTKEQFTEQFARLTAEWPRGYGESKAEMFAREFGGHEYEFFKKVIDQVLRRFRTPPQITELWSTISEVQQEMFKEKTRFRQPDFTQAHMSDISPQEQKRRWALLQRFISDKELQKRDPDWLRRNIWPNETPEQTEAKMRQIMLEDAKEIKRARQW